VEALSIVGTVGPPQLLCNSGRNLTIPGLSGIVPRILQSDDTEPKELRHLELLTKKAGFKYRDIKKESGTLGRGELYISLLLIGQLLPQISVPDWLMIQAPPYSNLSDK
jgi:hypothetical protein